MPSDLADWTATDLVAGYRRRDISPVEATESVLDRIGKVDPAINAFTLTDPDSALDSARESEQRWRAGGPRGPVDGVPTSIKDLLLTRGWPTLRGSKTIDPDQDWAVDSPAVARLREGGAVLIGKTTTPELGWKGVTDNPLTGITRNPWNPERTSGGSSGGAAAAVAAGMGPLAVGTDGGGSVRIPGSFCVILAFKATYGTVPIYPPSPFGTLAHVGPMTRTVADTALLLDVITGPDPRDWSALARPTAPFRYA
ncbi:MAG: amidase, partial [Aldersonia sp.]|nr:amidase [Aldersonia sp.]